MALDDYKVVLYRNQPDGWVAEIPSITGCYALMATKSEALLELERVFEMLAQEPLFDKILKQLGLSREEFRKTN